MNEEILFVYGTLRPDQEAWPLIAPFVVGAPVQSRVAGTLIDTGQGYPALLPPGSPASTVPGWLLRLDTRAFAVLDDYEGAEYQRVRVHDTEGRPCWTYLWCAELPAGAAHLPDGRIP